jgi:hypothetical protein
MFDAGDRIADVLDHFGDDTRLLHLPERRIWVEWFDGERIGFLLIDREDGWADVISVMGGNFASDFLGQVALVGALRHEPAQAPAMKVHDEARAVCRRLYDALVVINGRPPARQAARVPESYTGPVYYPTRTARPFKVFVWWITGPGGGGRWRHADGSSWVLSLMPVQHVSYRGM